MSPNLYKYHSHLEDKTVLIKIYHSSRHFSTIIHHGISKLQSHSRRTGGSVFHCNCYKTRLSSTGGRHRREPERGRGARATGLHPYLVKLKNPFVQHRGISLAARAYGFFFRRFSKINWSRRASRSSSWCFFSANSRMTVSWYWDISRSCARSRSLHLCISA